MRRMRQNNSQQPRCKQRGIKLVALQAAGYVTLAAFAKWMLTHPLGSLLTGIIARKPHPLYKNETGAAEKDYVHE